MLIWIHDVLLYPTLLCGICKIFVLIKNNISLGLSSDEMVVAVCEILSSPSTGTSVLERDLVGLFSPSRHQLVERIIKHKDTLVASFNRNPRGP